MTRAALLALALLAPACTTIQAERVVVLTPQAYLRSPSMRAEGVALVTSNLEADSITAQTIMHQTVQRSGE